MSYYNPDLILGMIVDEDIGMGQDVAAHTGLTTVFFRNNERCSQCLSIAWQVDRRCHLISASSFEKMCADMKQMRDDMSGDQGNMSLSAQGMGICLAIRTKMRIWLRKNLSHVCAFLWIAFRRILALGGRRAKAARRIAAMRGQLRATWCPLIQPALWAPAPALLAGSLLTLR